MQKVLLAFSALVLALGFAVMWSGLHPSGSSAQLLPTPTGDKVVPMTSILPKCDQPETGNSVRPDCDFTGGNGDKQNTNPALCFVVAHAEVGTVDQINKCDDVATSFSKSSNSATKKAAAAITKAKTTKGACYLVDMRASVKVSKLSTCDLSKKCNLGSNVVCAATEPCMGTDQIFGTLHYADQGEVQNCPAIQVGNDNIIWYDTNIPGDDGLIHPTIYRAKLNPAQYDFAYKNGLQYDGKPGKIGDQIFYDAGSSGGDPRKTCNHPDGASNGTYDADPNSYDNSTDLNAIYVSWGGGGAVRSGQARVNGAYYSINDKAPTPPSSFSPAQCAQNTGAYALITKDVNLIALAPDSPVFFASGSTASGGTPYTLGGHTIYDKIIGPDKMGGQQAGSSSVFTLDLSANSNNKSHMGGDGISGAYDLFIDGGDNKACASMIAVRIGGDPSTQQSWADKEQNYTGEAYLFPMATADSLSDTLDKGMISETYQDLVKNDGSNVFADASSCSMHSMAAYSTYGLASIRTAISAMHGNKWSSDEQTSVANASVCFASGMGWADNADFQQSVGKAISRIGEPSDLAYFDFNQLMKMPTKYFSQSYCNMSAFAKDPHVYAGIAEKPCQAGHGHGCYGLIPMRTGSSDDSSNHSNGQGSTVIYNDPSVDPYFQLSPIGSGEADNGYKLVEKYSGSAKGAIPYWPVPPAGSNIATANAASPGTAFGGSADDTTAPKINCHVSILNPLSWFLCPLASGLESVAAGLDNAINGALDFNTAKLADYKKPFDQIRNLALGLIGVAALVAIVSQAADLQILDAYTIRKMLPRLFIVAIGISLSWPLLSWFINLTNDLGIGVRQLIYLGASHSGGTNLTNGGATAVENILAIGAIASLGFVGLLSFAATAALAGAVAYLVLIIRQMVIIVLVIFAPVAIAAYMLPNTNKAWKFWWEAFSRCLLMFPMISALIAIGRVFASTVSDNLISFVAYFAPYFLIPLTFRLAGGVLGTLGGFVNDRSRGMFDGLKNFRGNRIKERRHNAKERAQMGNIFRNAPQGSRRAKLNEGIQMAAYANKAGLRPSKMKARVGAAISASGMSHAAKVAQESEAWKAFSMNDDLIHAALNGRGTEAEQRAYLERQGYKGAMLERNLQIIRNAQRDMGDEFHTEAIVANASTGTGYQVQRDAAGNVIGGGVGQAISDIERATGGDTIRGANAIARFKSAAEQARRFDLAPSFTSMFEQYQNISQADEASRNAVTLNATNDLTDKAIDVLGPGAVLGGRGHSVESLMPALQRRITKQMDEVHTANSEAQTAQANYTTAQASGDQVQIDAAKAQSDAAQLRLVNAQRGIKQVLASTSALLDVAGQVSPENGRILADGLLNGTITDTNGQTYSVSQAIEANRGDAQFQQMHREYTQQTQQQYANAQMLAQQAAMAGNANFTPPGGRPPGPNPIGP